MKKILLIAFASFAVTASAQTWNSAFNDGRANSQYGIGSARDAASARIVVGTYGSSSSIGAGPAIFGGGAGVTLANAGLLDGYVVKYNASNALLWAARISGPNSDLVKSVTTDPSGNIYVCGTFVGSTTFYNASGTAYTTLTASTSTMYDGFIVKYNSSGAIQWIVRPVTTSSTFDELLNIEYRNSTLAVLGKVNSNSSAGSFSLPTGYYLAKIDPSSGSTTWAYTCIPYINATSAVAEKPGLCIDNTGNIYVTSVGMNGTAYGLSSSIALTTNANAPVPAYAKYSNAGNLLWAKMCQASVTTGMVVGYGTSITVDDNNNLYIAGRVNSAAGTASLLFPAASGSLPVAVGSNKSCYIGKINTANGNASWMTRQVNFDWVDLAAGECGFMYAALTTTPSTASSITINGTSGTTYTGTTNGLHAVQFSSTGQLISTSPWHISQGGFQMTYLDYNNGSVDVVGTFRGTSTVPLTSGSTTLTASSDDMLAGTLTNPTSMSGVAVNVSASSPEICEGDYMELNAAAVGPGAPFTFSWTVYNPATSTYIPAPGTVFNSPNGSILDLSSPEYSPYYVDFFGLKICFYKVLITNCSGASTEYELYFVVRQPITYGQVQSQTICLNGNPPSPVFSVNAPNAVGYQWEYIAPFTFAWVSCSTNPTLYSGYNTASLTVNSPGLSMDGFQFRCVLSNPPCPDVITTPATLQVVQACIQDPGVKGKSGSLPGNDDIQVYPNPTSGQVTINLGSIEGIEAFELTVLNMEGRVIVQEKIRDVQTELDLSTFENGVYMYTIKGKDAAFNGKIILTH